MAEEPEAEAKLDKEKGYEPGDTIHSRTGFRTLGPVGPLSGLRSWMRYSPRTRNGEYFHGWKTYCVAFDDGVFKG